MPADFSRYMTVRSDAIYGKTDEQLFVPKNIIELQKYISNQVVEQILLVLSDTLQVKNVRDLQINNSHCQEYLMRDSLFNYCISDASIFQLI